MPTVHLQCQIAANSAKDYFDGFLFNPWSHLFVYQYNIKRYYKYLHCDTTSFIPQSPWHVLAAPLFPLSDPHVLEKKIANFGLVPRACHVLATLSPRCTRAVTRLTGDTDKGRYILGSALIIVCTWECEQDWHYVPWTLVEERLAKLWILKIHLISEAQHLNPTTNPTTMFPIYPHR